MLSRNLLRRGVDAGLRALNTAYGSAKSYPHLLSLGAAAVSVGSFGACAFADGSAPKKSSFLQQAPELVENEPESKALKKDSNELVDISKLQVYDRNWDGRCV